MSGKRYPAEFKIEPVQPTARTGYIARTRTVCRAIHRLAWLAAVACALPAGGSAVEAASVTPETFEFRPGVIVDTGPDGMIYMMSPGQGIEAIEMASGTRIWHTRLGQKPLVLHDNLLVAQVETAEPDNRLKLIGLNAADPEQVVFRKSIVLPADVRVSLADGMESAFRVGASIADGTLILDWSYLQEDMSGMERDTGVDLTERKDGSVAIRLADLRIVPAVPGKERADNPMSRLPKAVQSQLGAAQSPGSVLIAGAIVARVQRHSAGQGITLQRWDRSGRALPTLELFGNGLTYRYASADDRHLLASRRSSGNPDTQGGYLWSIHAVATGEPVAEHRDERVAAWFFVWDSLLVYEVLPNSRRVDGEWRRESLGIRAVDTRTDAAVWFRPVRDLRYGGESPPGMSGDPQPVEARTPPGRP